jgi:hypothetical protein
VPLEKGHGALSLPEREDSLGSLEPGSARQVVVGHVPQALQIEQVSHFRCPPALLQRIGEPVVGPLSVAWLLLFRSLDRLGRIGDIAVINGSSESLAGVSIGGRASPLRRDKV